MANGVDLDQTAPKEHSDLGLHCLLGNFNGQIFVVMVMVIMLLISWHIQDSDSDFLMMQTVLNSY